MEHEAFVTRARKLLAVATLTVSPAVSSARDRDVAQPQEPLAGITAPLPSGMELAPGTRVRVRTSNIVDVPGLARVESVGGKRLEAQGGGDLAFDWKSQTFIVTNRNGESVVLPTPLASFVGQIIAIDDNTLVMNLDGRPVRLAVPRSSVAQIEVSLGRTKARSRAASALRGAVIWGGVSALLFSAAFESPGVVTEVPQVFAGFAGLGAVIGALPGGQVRERWESVSPAGPVTVKAAMRPQGAVGLSLSFRF